MNTRTIAAGISAGMLALLFTGCSAPAAPAPQAAPEGPVGCSVEDDASWGDMIGLEAVEDEFGEYCHVTINTEAEALKYDASKSFPDELGAAGFTPEDANKVQTVAATYLVEYYLDSPLLERPSAKDQQAWLDENRDLFSEEIYTEATTRITDGRFNNAGLVLTGTMPTPLSRDSGPRAGHIDLKLNFVSVMTPEGRDPYLTAGFNMVADYPATDESVVEAVLAANPELTSSHLKSSNPELFDGVDGTVRFVGFSGLAFSSDDNSTITGANANWNLTTDTGLVIDIEEGEG